jgi:hypothetical protein
VLAIEPRYFARNLTIHCAFPQIRPFIMRDLPLPHAELNL